LKSVPVETKNKCSSAQHKELLSSDSAKWRSLSVRVTESPPHREARETPVEADPAIHLILNRTFRIEHLADGQWRGITYTKGTGVLNPAGHTRFLRYDFQGQRALGLLHLRLPQDTVDFVAQEMPKPGTLVKSSLRDIPFLDDPVISSFGFSIVSALRGGAPEFYAQAAAHWLAAHLLVGQSRRFEWHQSLADDRISDHRLVRVLEYIEAHLSERLDLRVLASEAGISPFHFAALFTKAVGATPHRHVHHLRMQAAKAMLRDTDKTVLDIALSCGFGSASHFASAFRGQFSQSPTEYRSSHSSFQLGSSHVIKESDGR
jgi:AraC family transcriptional regulator